jgi:methyl-accepting chemotaxis protein
MDTEKEIEKLKEQIKEINEQLKEMDGNMQKVNEQSDYSAKKIGETGDLLKDAVTSVKSLTTSFREFATDTKAQYEYAEGLAEKSKSTAVSIGLAVGRSKEFTKSFNRATAEVAKFGYDAQDVSNIMSEMVEQSGRVRIISPDEVSNIAKISKALSMDVDTTTQLFEQMDLMGVSSEKFYEHINNITKDSQKIGINASQVVKQLQNNMDQTSRMSFKNGVKGMTEMAKLAVQMRVNVSDMLGMADKFYEPEQAIEAIANLQMLGGDVAEAFGDPFEAMYLARNKPEELAKKVKAMTENMVQFNEETGEYELPAEAIMTLKSAGDQIGLNTDSIIDMAKQTSKIKDIKMNVSGNITDDDMREGLAGMAKMKDGKWVVDFNGEEVGIEDIGVDMAEKMLAAPKDEEDAIMQMAMNSMTTNDILKNILEAMKAGYVAETNVYELTEDIMRPGMEALMAGAEKQVEKTIEYLKETPYGKLREMMLDQAKQLGISTGEGVMKIFEGNFAQELAKALNDLKLETSLENILNHLKTMGGENINRSPQDPVQNDFIMRSSGEVTSFTNQYDLIGEKKGGPLDKLMDKVLPSNMGSSFPSKIEFGKIDISGKIEISSPDGSSKNIDMSSLKPMIEKTIISHLNGTFRNGGVASSKEATDYMVS